MIENIIRSLVQKAADAQLIDELDKVYATNRVLALLQLESLSTQPEQLLDDSIPNLLNKLVQFAIETKVIDDVFDDKEILSATIMNCFVARPSAVNKKFQLHYQNSPKEATDYFYALSKNSNYIQMNRIAKNIQFKSTTVYGEMDITINMSKPEKDPEQIKRESQLTRKVDYPNCVLCIENEGYAGRTGYAARANHRMIEVPLGNEKWYLQYSPYVYYNEHSILLAKEHRDMKISQHTFERLLLFIEKFPHYFIGSNADLPIVGGSILNHDHYQAGRYDFSMTHAASACSFSLEQFPTISASILDWPVTTIRLQCDEIEPLVTAATHILSTWQQYRDEQGDIVPFSGDIPHNTITPIARMRDSKFELDLVLRNNRTTDEHPLGIFHPHADVHHIKKENIGLIEVMGLAVLPARLKEELQDIKQFLLGKENTVAPYHMEWAQQLKHSYGTLSNREQVDGIVEKELGNKFAKVLGDTGVFKSLEDGQRFIHALNK